MTPNYHLETYLEPRLRGAKDADGRLFAQAELLVTLVLGTTTKSSSLPGNTDDSKRCKHGLQADGPYLSISCFLAFMDTQIAGQVVMSRSKRGRRFAMLKVLSRESTAT